MSQNIKVLRQKKTHLKELMNVEEATIQALPYQSSRKVKVPVGWKSLGRYMARHSCGSIALPPRESATKYSYTMGQDMLPSVVLAVLCRT